MRRRMRAWRLCCVLVLALGLPASGQAEVEWSAGMGGQFGGDYTVEGVGDIETDGGFLQRLGINWFPSQHIGFGGYFLFSTASSGFHGDIYVAEIGISIQPRLTLENVVGEVDFLLTPDVMVGYRGTFPEAGDNAHGLGLNLGLNLRARWDNGFSVFLEPGFLTQPVGGNDAADVTFSPIGYAIVGVGAAF